MTGQTFRSGRPVETAGDFVIDRTWTAHQALREFLHSSMVEITPQDAATEIRHLATLVSMTEQTVGRVAGALNRGALQLDLYLAPGDEYGYSGPAESLVAARGELAASARALVLAMAHLSSAADRLTWVGYNTPEDES